MENPQEEFKTGYVKSETEFLGVEFTLKDGYKQFVPKQETLEDTIYQAIGLATNEKNGIINQALATKNVMQIINNLKYVICQNYGMTPTEIDKINFITDTECNFEKMYQSLKDCWKAACAYTIGSHKDFKQTHPNFEEWFNQLKK